MYARSVTWCGVLLVTTASVSAQSPAAPVVQNPHIAPQGQPQPLDQGVEDVNPLSASLRDMQVDLRQPTGFQQVFRVPGQDNLFMRSSGAVHAVFPQSAYANRGGRTLPLIPAGTVFYIGQPPAAPTTDDEAQTPNRHVIDQRLNGLQNALVNSRAQNRIDTYIVDASAPAAGAQPQNANRAASESLALEPAMYVGPTVANDEAFRIQRIRELLARAVQAQAAAHADH